MRHGMPGPNVTASDIPSTLTWNGPVPMVVPRNHVAFLYHSSLYVVHIEFHFSIKNGPKLADAHLISNADVASVDLLEISI